MRNTLLFLFTILIPLVGSSQITKGYHYTGDMALRTGTYVHKDIATEDYYTTQMRYINSVPTTIVTKIDEFGNTVWNTSVAHSQYSNTYSSTCDILVNATSIYVQDYLFFAASCKSIIYQFDLNGTLIDSVEFSHGSINNNRYQNEMSFTSTGDILSIYEDENDSIQLILLDPNLNILDQQAIGYNTFYANTPDHDHFVETNGSTIITAYNTSPDTINIVVLDASLSITEHFKIYSPNGKMTDFELKNDNYLILINKEFGAFSAVDNPIRLMEVSTSGAVISDQTFNVQYANIHTDLELLNNEIIIAGRAQISGSKTGAITRISTSITDEYEFKTTAITDIETSGDDIFGSGIDYDGYQECSDNYQNGAAFLLFNSNESPKTEAISPVMHLLVNNIDAGISSNSRNFHEYNNYAAYKVQGTGGTVPNESTIYNTSLLIAAQDESDLIHSTSSFFTDLYRSGPITNQNDYTSAEKDNWERVWKITRDEIDAHIMAFQNGDNNYTIPEVIMNWPAHGDMSKGQDQDLARFKDINNNGTYNPEEGEYPLIKGDYCVLSIYNDVNIDTAENCIANVNRINAQIFEYVYGFDCGQDSSLQNTLFVYYEVINKSGMNFDSTWIGNFNDFDILVFNDDYIATDPSRGLIYGMNASLTGPEQGYSILGSKQNIDAADNAFGIGSGESVNGFGYGDGIADNERLGLTNSMYYNNSGGVTGDPTSLVNNYHMLQSIWNDGTHLTYGGTGHNSSSQESDYAFPGGDDTLFGGTGGVDPGFDWSEAGESNVPNDRRMVGSSGPFDLASGDTIFFDICYITGMESTGGGYTSHEALMANTDSARSYFYNNLTPCGQDFDFYAPFDGPYNNIGIIENSKNWQAFVYPNTANNLIMITQIPVGSAICIHTLAGQLIYTDIASQQVAEINVSNFKNGVYIITIRAEDKAEHIKLVKQ